MIIRDDGNDLKRLHLALEALADDVYALKQRPPWWPRKDVEPSQGNGNGSHGIDAFIDRFAFAVKNNRP